MAQIVVVQGPDKGRAINLQGDRIAIGRDPECELALGDRTVSRRHCEIRREGDRWVLADLGSRNKTYLNDDPVERAPLADGDIIGVGDTEIRFELEPEEARGEEFNTTILRRYRYSPDSVPSEEAAGLRSRLSVLASLGRRVDGVRSSRELLHLTISELLPVLSAHWGVGLLRSKNSWKIIARTGAPGRHAFSKTLLSRLLEGEESVLYAGVSSEEPPEVSESIRRAKVQAVVAAPLRSAGEILGALYFAKQEGSFGEEDLFAVSAASNQVALLLGHLLEEERLAEERRVLIEQIRSSHRIVGTSKAISEVLEFIARAAPTDATVLIRGETGTGKELVASAIHYASPRAGKPFVQLNCAAIPENLLESELFGHEKGAFTGATSRKLGHFEVADGGTVFLDEVAELSPACQAKVLRLIEEKRFERVGGTESISVDVRILAATNQDLRKAVSEGRFREDLYWRLDVLHIEIPPLRERPDDILLLAEYFLENVRGPGGKRLRLAPDAKDALLSYSWPGNVRQLKNVIENAVIMSRGEEIHADDLRLVDFGRAQQLEAAEAESWKPRSLAEVEREHILRVLKWTKGNKKRAAEILGIERGTLYARLRSYGMLKEKSSGS